MPTSKRPIGRRIYRSSDNGVTWQKMSDYNQGSMYYADIFTDPLQFDRIYVPDVLFQVSDDGGRTMRPLGTRGMHVDNHIIWIDPANADHYLVGNDGGLYRSWDRGATWTFFENLPLAQYYDVDADNALPFYNVYGGLQDNNSLGMPSRTRSDHGIMNSDVFVTQGGDGFVSRVDPEDPNIIYAELQHGVMVRFDKRTHERVGIQPQEAKGDVPCAGTGTRRSSSLRSRTGACTRRRSSCIAPTTAATAGRRSRPTSRARCNATSCK